MKKKIIQSSIVGVIKEVVLTKAERREVEETIKKVKKLKFQKENYFTGFQTRESK
jgi:uncharacterized 2Fe-2S/4Fe-4S cluster protein (DUF4445 family)